MGEEKLLPNRSVWMEQPVMPPPQREPTVISFTPTSDPAPGPGVNGAVGRGQADGIYVICEIHGGRQLQEAHVVVVSHSVVRRVTRCLGNASGHFVGVGSCLVDATQKNRDGAGVTFFEPKSGISHFIHNFCR